MEATTNSGNIRSMEKAMWDEQTYQQSQQSLQWWKHTQFFSAEQIPTFLGKTAFFICSFHRYQEHPLFTMGRQQLYLQKLVTSKDTKGGKNP